MTRPAHAPVGRVPTVEDERAARVRLRRRFAALGSPLPSESEIVTRWGGRTQPEVTVLCSVHDQVHLVGDALHGILMQRTDFPFRVVVTDDASTDGTQAVLRDIAARYPTLVRLDLRPRNLGSSLGTGAGRPPAERLRRAALIEGPFVALCEGDDVWTDPDKLQRQIDDLRAHPSATMSVAGTLKMDLALGIESDVGVVRTATTYRGALGAYHHTSTFVMRSDAHATMVRDFQIPHRIGGDFAMLMYMARRGEVRVLPGVVSVYWSNGRGVWSSLSQFEQHRRQYRNHRRVLLALGAPWPWDELRWLLRKEAKLFRPAITAGEYRAALGRAPLALALGAPRATSRAFGRMRSGVGVVLRRVAGWTRGDSNP